MIETETPDSTGAPAVPAPSGEAAPSQTVKAQLRLRELILSGELPAGARIAELALVEMLGVSRTPIRMALMRLQQEGLLDSLPQGGFAVKGFSEADIHDAIEVRGTLEGLAARLAAERGVAAVLLTEMKQCVAEIDAVLAQADLTDEAFSAYVEHNARFHELLVEMAGSDVVARQLESIVTLPFASPNAFVMLQASGPDARDGLVVAQEQHRRVVEAIENREGGRAEALMREHARIARRNLSQALTNHKSLQLLPGGRLIRRRAAR
jgi:GntR family transcriptional regulator, vanillate catabolism transcriptional regulator